MSDQAVAWRLYYGDGSTFDSTMGSWQDAPPRNVQALVTPEPLVGSERDTPLFGRSFYIWWPGAEKPWSVDWAGLLDYLLEVGAITDEQPLVEVSFAHLVRHGVKFGRSIGNRAFREIMEQVNADADGAFPRKSAFLFGEAPSEGPTPPLED